MADHLGWYPPSQICYPPELPPSFKNIRNLKPIVGVPSDDEVTAIYTVIHAASRVSDVPGMHDPKFFVQLADHLFNVQMARYRNKYSLITFPSDATYIPPGLPAHISVDLEPISGAPSDNEITKVHEATQTYQELRRIPSLFDARVNMELSQHLFDIQMARHMRTAGDSQARPVIQETPRPANLARAAEFPQNPSERSTTTNNAGTGSNTVDVQLASGIEVRELIGRSNQLAERFNQLLERSNELTIERDRQTPQVLDERLNQVLDRLTSLVEQSHQPAKHCDSLSERFNQLFERFNQLVEQLSQPAHRANELAERSNELVDKANQLMERLGRSSELSNQLSEKTKLSWDRIGDVLGNLNRVLVGVQHAIVRNHKANTINAIDSLVNEKGQTFLEMPDNFADTFKAFSECYSDEPDFRAQVLIDGISQSCYIPNLYLGDLLQFYGISDELCDPGSGFVINGEEDNARARLGAYFSSRFG